MSLYGPMISPRKSNRTISDEFPKKKKTVSFSMERLNQFRYNLVSHWVSHVYKYPNVSHVKKKLFITYNFCIKYIFILFFNYNNSLDKIKHY